MITKNDTINRIYSLAFENPILENMVATNQMEGVDGQTVQLQSGIHPAYINALYRMVTAHQPKNVLEIGMSYGFSTLAILSALHDADQSGHLVSIDPDPYDRPRHPHTLAAIDRAGLGNYHDFVRQPDFISLPNFLQEGRRFDFAYVDGNHRFEDVMLAIIYLDKLLPVNGIIGFNDCALPSVNRALTYLKTHRKYRELQPDWGEGLASLIVRLGKVSGRIGPDRYFIKMEHWEPAWNYYRRF
jgi:predicted O-methyltransferase YrrM